MNFLVKENLFIKKLLWTKTKIKIPAQTRMWLKLMYKNKDGANQMKQRVVQVSNVVVINKVNHAPVCASDCFGPSQFTLHKSTPERITLLREGYLKLFLENS